MQKIIGSFYVVLKINFARETVLATIAERAFMKTLEGGCSVPVAVNSKVPICSKSLFLWESFWIFFSSGFGQWLRIARWCVESWWEHIHHRHREGIWNIHNDLLAKVFKRFLSPMMTTWLPPLPNDHVHPALWVSTRRHKLSSLFGFSFRKRENT